MIGQARLSGRLPLILLFIVKMKNHSAGFALLYAVLLTGVVLTVGLGLSSILRKQIILSSTGAASQKAYYAANAIKECAIHWGIYGAKNEDGNFVSVFGGWVETTNESGESDFEFMEPDNDPNQIYCQAEAITVIKDKNTSGQTRIFYLNPSPNSDFEVNGACARAKIVLTPEKSTVYATGYNLACEATDNPRRTERQIAGQGNFAAPF